MQDIEKQKNLRKACVLRAYQIMPDGMTKLLPSSGSTVSDMQITAPAPTGRSVLFSAEKALIMLLSGEAVFLISAGWRASGAF